MSQSDSFIEEVTDAVRRDRLFATMRRWAWLAVLLVVLIVGGAAFREWRLSQARSDAQARGDALTAGLAAEDADALAAVGGTDGAAAVAALLAASFGEDPEAAAARLDAVASNAELPARYRDLAVLKGVLAAPGTPLEERRAALESIAAPGAPYRLLAQEQLAILSVEAGERDDAVERLTSILEDAELTEALRDRARQLIVALGGSLDAA